MENRCVMKRLKSLLFIPLIVLSGCAKQKEPEEPKQEPHYEEVENLHIKWENLFNQEDDKYYAYIYSVTCVPCSMLREQVIEFAKASYVHFYFIYPSDEIPFVENPAQADGSIGASSIENVYCYSTPCLIEITDHTITNYSRDHYEIKDFMETFV